MSHESGLVPYTVITDDYSVWQQGTILAGNTVPAMSDDWESNLHAAQAHLASFTLAHRVVRVIPKAPSVDLIDLDRTPEPLDVLRPLLSEGVITSDPAHIIFANPADCGEIAVSAPGRGGRQPVIGLFHASRAQVDRKSYVRSLEYLCVSRAISPDELTVRISPSARAESYAFANIATEQKTAPRWQNHIWQRQDGLWHVDFHNRMLEDLRDFGIKDDQMLVSPDDTAHPDSNYFSHYRSLRSDKPDGGNGLLFALRS